jgi:hypothetical protein
MDAILCEALPRTRARRFSSSTTAQPIASGKRAGRSVEHSVIFAASGKSRPASQANPDKTRGIFGYSSWLSYALSSDSRLELELANTP